MAKNAKLHRLEHMKIHEKIKEKLKETEAKNKLLMEANFRP